MTKQSNVVIVGAGKSSFELIRFLSERDGVNLLVADIDNQNLQAVSSYAETQVFDINDKGNVENLFSTPGLLIVISMLPHFLHLPIARMAAEKGLHFLCASYATPELEELAPIFSKKGKCMILEMGLDPGIDHMSGISELHRLQQEGYFIHAFETFTGGLLAEEFEKSNPWRYKFTWNPRNVVLAGQGHVKFRQEGRYKYIPYHRLFRRAEMIEIPGVGFFEGYANRDSLKYIKKYGLDDIPTFYRGTLRRPGFCKTWNCLVQLGATDDTYQMEGVHDMSHRQFVNSFLSYNPDDSVELKLAHYLNLDMEGEEMHKLQWMGFFDEESIGLQSGSPAQILEHILKKKWTMEEQERDMIVMWHKFVVRKNEVQYRLESWMRLSGQSRERSAMAITVGLPLAVTAEKLLTGVLTCTGLRLPYQEEIYRAVLPELANHGIKFDTKWYAEGDQTK